MTTRTVVQASLPGVARCVVVAAAAAGLVLGAGRVGAVSDGMVTPDGSEVARSVSTSYCTGDPFVDADEGAPRADLSGGVTAYAAPREVLTGVVDPSEDPGRITIGAPADDAEDEPDEEPTSGPPVVSTDELDGTPVRVTGTAERAPGLLATQYFTADGKRVSGLAASPCQTPTADAWLVAGGGEDGRQERLVLTNPGGNAVTVRLEVVGAPDDTQERTVVVPAHERRVVLLDAIGGTEAPQAVHVTSTGGLVVPTIVEHQLDGLTPAGVEAVTPTAPPAERLVLPGGVGGSSRGIVLAAPGGEDAVVQISRLGDGPARGVEVVTVPADSVLDVDLPSADGAQGWLVQSDEPVVAAAHVTTTDASHRSDVAWSVATPSVRELGGAALPPATAKGMSRRLHLVATGGPASVDVLLETDGTVESRRVDLGRDRSVSVAVGSADAVWVRPRSGRVHAAVLLLGRDGGAHAQATSVPVLPARVSVRDVPVTRVR